MRTVLLPVILIGAALAGAQPNRPADDFQTSAGVVRITPVRHASLMIEGGGQVIHVDPTGDGNYEGLPPADLILITDIHGDHMDPKGLAKVRKPGTVIVGPSAVAAGMPDVTVLRNGESREIGPWKIEAVAAYNNQRGPAPGKLYHDKGRGNGYVITYGGKRFYFSGDTEATPEMRALKNIEVAYICMNLPYTMTPEEAAEAVRAFKPRVAIPYHYRGSDLSVFEKALAGSGVEVRIRNWYY
jgi:L-ascorbate metabolism protein UlaG (beta-lactamase superfamily)